MAKDGTMRGGARVGSGRKSKALTEKIGSGLAASVIELPEPKQVQYIRFTVASQMVQSTREGVALFSLRLADFIPY